METQHIEVRTWSSALIKTSTYDSKECKLTVEFNNGKCYDYVEFLPEAYEEFVNAESQGKHFLTKIKAVYKDTPEKVIKL